MPAPRDRAIAVALTLGLSWVAGAGLARAEPRPAGGFAGVDLQDARLDDRGPGGYVHPSGRDYPRGQYDLRRFEVELADGGETVVFRVTLDTPVHRPREPRLTEARILKLDNGVYVQNVDIYIDAFPGRGRGATESVPGRRVRFAPEEAWDIAVILTPQPHKARSQLGEWSVGGNVVVPSLVRSNGPMIEARVPVRELGARPEAGWGYAVLLSGASWDDSWEVVDRLADRYQTNVFTLPVKTVAEPMAFGGGELGGVHTQVIDLLDVPESPQSASLGSFDDRIRALAEVPMVYPARAPGKRARRISAPSEAPVTADAKGADARVKDVLDDTVVLVPREGLVVAPFQLGEVLDAEGARVGKVVVATIYPEFVLAKVVEGLDAVARGQAVRFGEKSPRTERADTKRRDSGTEEEK